MKLIVQGVGEIDFLGASPLLEDATIAFEFGGRSILRERPSEVIVKKIYHGGSTFKSRDVFDLAGAYIALPTELTDASLSLFLTSDIYSQVRLRIETRMKAFEEQMVEEVNPTESGLSYLENACGLALEALDFMQNRPGPELRIAVREIRGLAASRFGDSLQDISYPNSDVPKNTLSLAARRAWGQVGRHARLSSDLRTHRRQCQ